jgi:hypothetical protein
MPLAIRYLPAVVVLLACCGQAGADGGTVYERQNDNGAIELTNIPDDAGNYRMVVGPATTGTPTPAVAPAPVPSPAVVPEGIAAETPDPSPDAAASSAVPAPANESPYAARLRVLYDGARDARAAAGNR